MSDLARLKIWDDPAIRDSLSWYLAVAENRRPAKFRIAATLPIQLDPHFRGGGALGRARPPDADISRKVAGNPVGRAIAGDSGRAKLARAVPRACLSDARPLQFLSVELPCRPCGRYKVRRLQARFRFSGQLAFPSHRRGAVLPRHGRFGHDLLHLLQYAMRLLPKWRHQHRQRQWRGDGPAHACGDGMDAAP